MNASDAIKEVYNMYSDEETPPQIVEVTSEEMDLELDLEDRPANSYSEL